METITITHRIINGKSIYNKRFDNYDKGFYGQKISKAEYTESRRIKWLYDPITTGNDALNNALHALNIVERITLRAEVQSLKGVWKVLFNAAYKFEIENGEDHETAEYLALRSIHKKMHLAKKARNIEYGH